MPRGGKRPGAGRKAARPKTARRLMLELSPVEAKQLAALEAKLEAPASVVMRYALGHYSLAIVGSGVVARRLGS